MNLWNEHGSDRSREPVTPDDTKEQQALKLGTRIKNKVSERVSEVFLKSVNLEIAEEISRSMYDALREEDPNEKIEGFYQICKLRGLNGEQGVIIPKQNVRNLSLNDDILKYFL